MTVPTAAPVSALVLDPNDPLPAARLFVDDSYRVDGRVALRHQAGVFYGYERPGYREVDEATLRADMYAFLESARCLTKAATLVPFKPTQPKVSNALDALRAVTNLPAATAAPCWLGCPRPVDPLDVLAVTNGLLHLPTGTLAPPTPDFFTLNGLDFAYDADAPVPHAWLAFLASIWPDDPDSIAALQEFMGYLLTPRTHLQKILLTVGPKRSGKGTIGRIMRHLFGARSVCGPTLASLGQPFGRATLIGKSVAILADARLSGRTDAAAVAEHLLAISGEDSQSVPRKFLPDWHGTLPTRFVILTNELPAVADASGALASRFVVLSLTKSFYGQEDTGLLPRLLPELPAILNWAIVGWRRLTARGHFVQPASARTLIQTLEELGSPITAFLHARCEFKVGAECPQSGLFAAWQAWCLANGHERAGTTQVFGRNLAAAAPWLKQSQPRVAGVKVRVYKGLRLRDHGEDDDHDGGDA